MKTYKYKLKPNKTQIKIFDEWINTCRYLYNIALEERITVYKSNGSSISKFSQYNELPDLKKHFHFIGNVYSDVLQETLDRLDSAYKSFFRGNGFPRFAKKNRYNSFTYKRHFIVNDKTIKLPKIGEVKYFNSRTIKGTPKTATIKKETDGWYICITLEQELEKTSTLNNQEVGIDLGIVHFATLSDGEVINSPLFLKENLQKVKDLSRNKKNKDKLARLHLKISRQRKDFLHKTTTKLANTFNKITIEDLKVTSMIGTSTSLNRDLLDVSFYNFRLFLQYKMKERSQELIIVNPAYTSQTCSNCGVIDKKSRKTQSEFKCTSCGLEINADFNASKNILSRGTT